MFLATISVIVLGSIVYFGFYRINSPAEKQHKQTRHKNRKNHVYASGKDLWILFTTLHDLAEDFGKKLTELGKNCEICITGHSSSSYTVLKENYFVIDEEVKGLLESEKYEDTEKSDHTKLPNDYNKLFYRLAFEGGQHITVDTLYISTLAYQEDEKDKIDYKSSKSRFTFSLILLRHSLIDYMLGSNSILEVDKFLIDHGITKEQDFELHYVN